MGQMETSFVSPFLGRKKNLTALIHEEKNTEKGVAGAQIPERTPSLKPKRERTAWKDICPRYTRKMIQLWNKGTSTGVKSDEPRDHTATAAIQNFTAHTVAAILSVVLDANHPPR